MSNNKFRDIAKMIEQRINDGFYPPQSKLPTHKALANELDTTAVTVAKAYQLLVQEEKVESFVGRGTFVCNHTNLETAIQATGIESDYNFTIIQPCLFHNAQPLQAAFQHAFDSLPTTLLGYTDGSGLASHRQAGVTWASHYGLEVESHEQILLASGAQHALDTLIRTYTQPGDTIAVEALTYPGILSIAEQSSRHIAEVAMDDQGMCPDALWHCITTHQPKLVIIIPSHQNPTAVTMPLKRREAIANVIRRRKLWLIEDDIYGFLNPYPLSPITNFIPEQSFHITSLSKALSPALRCAYIKTPEAQFRNLGTAIRSSIWQGSPLIFEVASQLIESQQAFDMASNQQELAHRRQTFARQTLKGFIAPESSGSYHLWLKLPPQWRRQQFMMEAKSQQLLVSSGNYFCQGSHGNDYIRVALMAIDDELHFKQGIRMLAQLLSESPSASLNA